MRNLVIAPKRAVLLRDGNEVTERDGPWRDGSKQKRCKALFWRRTSVYLLGDGQLCTFLCCRSFADARVSHHTEQTPTFHCSEQQDFIDERQSLATTTTTKHKRHFFYSRR